MSIRLNSAVIAALLDFGKKIIIVSIVANERVAAGSVQ